MVFDERHENEPEEPDPGGEAEDVSFDVTDSDDSSSFDVTGGDDLVADLPDASEAGVEVRRVFYTCVILLKVGLLATTLGILVAYAWGWHREGLGLVLIGLVALFGTARIVWQFDPDQAE